VLARAHAQQAKRQKLLGIKPAAGGLITDATLLSACLPQKSAIMMMGTCEEVIAADAIAAASAPPVLDDLDDIPDEPLDVRHRPENVAKLARRVAAQKCEPLNAPRAGKKLLVLDIDYTLFDHRTTAETPAELARPHLHSFLTAAYAAYGASAAGGGTHSGACHLPDSVPGLIMCSCSCTCCVQTSSSGPQQA
jgi:ubiquitin-like domain-containing CTD phosphatase 1